MARIAVLSTTLLLPLTAMAGDPEVQVADDGTVVARMLVDAPASTVREAVHRVQHTSSGNVLELRFQPDGDCQSVFRKTRGLWSPLTMRTRLCPTQDGWRELLVQSEDYSAYETEWVIRDTTTGPTEMQLRVRTSVNLAVPGSLVRQGTIDGLRKTFSQVLRLVSPRAAE